MASRPPSPWRGPLSTSRNLPRALSVGRATPCVALAQRLASFLPDATDPLRQRYRRTQHGVAMQDGVVRRAGQLLHS